MKSTFELLAEAIATNRLDALLIGGYALHAYGVNRQTMDVDFLIVGSDAGCVGAYLTRAGYAVETATDTYCRYRHESPYFIDVDILFVDRSTMDKMIPTSITTAFKEGAFRVPSLMHLIALKLHGIRSNPERKQKDLADISELIRLNRAGISEAELRQTCERFGTTEIIDVVMENLR